MRKIFFFVIILYFLIILRYIFSLNFFLPTYAIDMESPLYKIKFGTIDIAGGKKQSSNYSLSDSIGQTAANQFNSSGYIIKAGFQYLYSIYPFFFSISQTRINFGTIVANNPQTQQTILTVSNPSAHGYQVTAIEEGSMRTLNGSSSIPDTTCDGGSDTCNETLAKLWTLTSAYGFGYNMSGNDIPSDFINSNYYRPFPDRLNSENPAVVMSSNNIGKNRQATVTFKINVSPVQPAGSYQTIINFVAIPTF